MSAFSAAVVAAAAAATAAVVPLVPIHPFVKINECEVSTKGDCRVVFYIENQGGEDHQIMILAPGIEYDQEVPLTEDLYSTWNVHGIRVGDSFYNKNSAPEIIELLRMTDTTLRMMTDFFGLDYFVGPEDDDYDYHGFRAPLSVPSGIVFTVSKASSHDGPPRDYPRSDREFEFKVREIFVRTSYEPTILDPEELPTFEEENEYGHPSSLFDDRALEVYRQNAQENERRSYTNLHRQ